MSLQEQIQKDIFEAMKQKDTLRLNVLRGIKTAIKNREIEKIKSLEEGEVRQVIQTLVKQRKDSIEQFSKGGRADLVAQEEGELRILETFLPAAVTPEEIRRVVAEVIAQLQAASPKDMGRVMKAVMAQFAGKNVDGKLVSETVRGQLP